MANIHKGRYSAEIEGEFVVFIIGMRVNRLWAIHKWLPASADHRVRISPVHHKISNIAAESLHASS